MSSALAPRTLAMLAVGVLGVSLAAPIGTATAAPALAVAFWRCAMGTAVGAPFALVRRRGELAAFGAARLRTALLAGLLLGVHFALWIPSLRLTSVTASTALVTTTPLWVLAIDRLLGLRVPRRVLAGVLVALAGALVVTGVDAAGSARAALGDLLALAGGAAAAGYVIAGERVRRGISTASYTLVAYGSAAVVLVPICLVGRASLGGYAARTWVELAVLALAAQVIGHSALNGALRSAGATAVALATLLEVPGAALVAWAWLGQRPPAAIVPGALLVIAGIVVVLRAQAAVVAERVTAEVESGA